MRVSDEFMEVFSVEQRDKAGQDEKDRRRCIITFLTASP